MNFSESETTFVEISDTLSALMIQEDQVTVSSIGITSDYLIYTFIKDRFPSPINSLFIDVPEELIAKGAIGCQEMI